MSTPSCHTNHTVHWLYQLGKSSTKQHCLSFSSLMSLTLQPPLFLCWVPRATSCTACQLHSVLICSHSGLSCISVVRSKSPWLWPKKKNLHIRDYVLLWFAINVLIKISVCTSPIWTDLAQFLRRKCNDHSSCWAEQSIKVFAYIYVYMSFFKACYFISTKNRPMHSYNPTLNAQKEKGFFLMFLFCPWRLN